MNKPKKHTKKCYDYLECMRYIEKKYNIDTRNYANKSFGSGDNTPYLDFWHWVIQHHQVDNGSYITFDEDYFNYEGDDTEQWIKDIYRLFITEFADEDGYLEMRTIW